MTIDLTEFLSTHMQQSGRFIAARLQAALALLERLRDTPVLVLSEHKKPNSSGLISHETFGKRAHERLNLVVLNKTHGRRSCDVGGWGQELLDLLASSGFEAADSNKRTKLINEAEEAIANVLRAIIEADPLEARVKGRTAESVIRDILKQAEEKGKSGDVAQYLVGAKLMLRLKREIPVLQANKRDRKSRADRNARTGDYEIENSTIEIAIGVPDAKHLEQVEEALENSDLEVWLLTRHDRVASWLNELQDRLGADIRRVVVSSVEAFIGQNMSEIGGFSARGKADALTELFRLYNERWIAEVGTPGIQIVIK